MVIVRDSCDELEAAAQSYETDNEIMVEVLKGPLITDSFAVDRRQKDTKMQMEKCSSMQPQALIRNSIPQIEPSSDCKQGEDEDESDSEAFMVKRRRVLPLTRKKFQIDEQGLTLEKSMV